MSNEEAIESAKKLIEWARDRWGVQTEKRWVCPSDNDPYSHSDYEGYCPNDGFKLKETIVESQSQDWQYKLENFMYDPDDYTIAEAKP